METASAASYDQVNATAAALFSRTTIDVDVVGGFVPSPRQTSDVREQLNVVARTISAGRPVFAKLVESGGSRLCVGRIVRRRERITV
jgi:hypothetical protein